MVITLDGPAGSGKSTVARILAGRLKLPYLNSGYIYRAITLGVLEAGGDFEDHDKVGALIRNLDLRFEQAPGGLRVFMAGRDVTPRLKDPDVTPQVYRIANDAFYRSLLVEIQRQSASPRGLVAEGRDMGTVIFPEAEYKFFLDASPEERARRQHRELTAAGHDKSYDELLGEIIARDQHDRERETAPLRVAPDARVVCTDGLSIEGVVETVLRHVSGEKGNAGKGEASR